MKFVQGWIQSFQVCCWTQSLGLMVWFKFMREPLQVLISLNNKDFQLLHLCHLRYLILGVAGHPVHCGTVGDVPGPVSI